MGGGGGGGGNDGVDYQREQEELRQAKIRQGMTQIDQIFNGVDVPVAYSNPMSTAAGASDGDFYDTNGRKYSLRNGNGGNLRWSGKRNTGQVQFRNDGGAWENLPATLYGGVQMQHQGGFDDAYYNKRSQAYQDFALPQLQDQYKDQQKSLTYALSRGGNLGSSLAAAKTADLNKDYALQQQNVYDTGQDYANKARASVAEQKNNLVSLLQASADPDAVASMAQTQAANLSAMPTFSPLSPVISNVASGLGTYLSNQQTADAVKKAYSDTYTNSLNRSSGKVG